MTIFFRVFSDKPLHLTFVWSKIFLTPFSYIKFRKHLFFFLLAFRIVHDSAPYSYYAILHTNVLINVCLILPYYYLTFLKNTCLACAILQLISVILFSLVIHLLHKYIQLFTFSSIILLIIILVSMYCLLHTRILV